MHEFLFNVYLPIKTYNIDAQTPDSAGTATAYLSGVKTRIGVIGLDGHAVFGDCKSSKGAEINSILDWAHRAGKSVGVVTNTRITHATPCKHSSMLFASFTLNKPKEFLEY